MDNYFFEDYLMGSRFKKKRRRKQLVKKDFEKQLISIHKEQRILYKSINDLPLELLETPYQKGWVRFFVVREDVLKSKEGIFFNELLEKINTFQYSNEKSFTIRRKRFRKKVDVPTEQKIYAIPDYQWTCNKLKLSDKEKSYFIRTEEWSNCYSRIVVSYKFTESWRYVLRIRPYMITHRKAVDAQLERDSDRLENYIVANNLRPKITKIKEGWVQYRSYREIEKPKDWNPFKNKSLDDLYQMYLDEKTENNGK